MSRRALRLAPAVALLAPLATLPALAQDAEVSATVVFEGGASFSYGYPESDGTTLAFSCEAGGGFVSVASFIGSEGLSEGESAEIRLSAGGASVVIDGFAFANELDGQTDLEADVVPGPALAAVFAGPGPLVIAVPGAERSLPLDGAAAAYRRFAATCGG